MDPDVQVPIAPAKPSQSPTNSEYTQLTWSGEVPSQKWMNVHAMALARFAGGRRLKLSARVEAAPECAVSQQKIEASKVALSKLGLPDHVSTAQGSAASMCATVVASLPLAESH